MADEDYEILPHQLLADLKYEVEALKKKLTQPDAKVNELILEIESLKDSIHELNVVFEKALQETKEEDLSKIIKTINERMEAVINQNETIAKGMIAISDKLDDFMQKQSSLPGRAEMQRPGMSSAPGMQGIAPPPFMIAPSPLSPPPFGSERAMAPQPEPAPFPPPSFGPSSPFGKVLPPPPPSPVKKRTGLFK
ncbi:MAG: hypothetical protein AB1668_06565 [Nanoarchaeota archaeon]